MTHVINPEITKRQKQIITGTILGGSSIIRPKGGQNCYLSMRCKNSNWLQFKAIELTNLSSSKPFTIERTNRWHSLCYPIFNDFYDEFYFKNNRKLKPDTLDLLTDIALAIWYIDVGKMVAGRLIMNTNIWGKEGTDFILDYFNAIGFQSEIFKERERFRVRMTLKATNMFRNMVEPHLPIWAVKSL